VGEVAETILAVTQPELALAIEVMLDPKNLIYDLPGGKAIK